MCENSNNP
jgi:hypothetical protein